MSSLVRYCLKVTVVRIKLGVPHGSVLGRLLCTVRSSFIESFHSYVDDILLHLIHSAPPFPVNRVLFSLIVLESDKTELEASEVKLWKLEDLLHLPVSPQPGCHSGLHPLRLLPRQNISSIQSPVRDTQQGSGMYRIQLRGLSLRWQHITSNLIHLHWLLCKSTMSNEILLLTYKSSANLI